MGSLPLPQHVRRGVHSARWLASSRSHLSLPLASRISIFPFGMVGVYGVLVSFSGFLNAYFNYYVITKVESMRPSTRSSNS